MLRPSYSELMDIVNANELVDSKITSRYTIVLAAAKRARQIIDGAHPLTYAPTNDRAVSTAVKEMNEGKLAIKVPEELLEGNYERMLKDQYKYRNLSSISKDDLREDLKDNYDAAAYSTDDDETDDERTLFRERYGDTDLSGDATATKDDFVMYENDTDDDADYVGDDE